MRRRRATWIAVAITAAVLSGLPAAGRTLAHSPDLAGEVDPMVGTFPVGFTVPGAVVPFGMVQNSPDTTGPVAYTGYSWMDPTIRGFSLVHLSGPGVPKGGDLPFMPTLPALAGGKPAVWQAAYSHVTEQASPGAYRVRLLPTAIDVELAATTRTALQRYTFPPGVAGAVIADVGRSAEGNHAGFVTTTDRPGELVGWTEDRYRVWFVARFDRPFSAFHQFGDRPGGWAEFPGGGPVTMQAGISFVDLDGARANLDGEAPGFDVKAVQAAARAAWNTELGRVKVSGGTAVQRRSFYTALYHAHLHPNVESDVDGRYLGFDGAVHQVEPGRAHYANFSSWDTYKGHNQLLATLQPGRYRDMARSLLAAYQEGGFLPRWGEHNFDASHMSGDPIIPMLADAWCRGVLDDLDATTRQGLYDAMLALNARRTPSLDALGFVPVDESGRGAGTTLEYGVADFALALVADRLGRTDEAATLVGRAQRWQNLLDPDTRFIRPRTSDGRFIEPFDPTAEEGFQEGNSWQYSWLAPHDARGLFDAMGGDAVAVDRLDTLFSYPLAARVPLVVGEVQNRLTLYGLVYRTNQYAPGNEHDLQVPWMYAFAGQPWKGAAVHRQIQDLFRPTPDGLPGNDDLGGLSGWYLWSAMGLGPVTPGAPFYVLGSPQFDRVEVNPAGGGAGFALEAPGASHLHKYVRSARLDGLALDRAWVGHAELMGKTLRLEMGGRPARALLAPAAATRPPSLADSPLSAFGCRAS